MKKHPIVELLQARAWRKSPFNDGNKIAFVLPGGIMSGVTLAGAMIGLQQIGVSKASDVIETVSSGFAGMSYTLSDAPEFGSSVYFEEFAGKRFINFAKIFIGKSPIDYDWAIKSVRDLKPFIYQRIWDSGIEILLRVKDRQKKIQYLNLADYDTKDFFDIFRAAISQPVISQGGLINGLQYFDGQWGQRNLNDHLLSVMQKDYTHVVIIYNRRDQRVIDFPPSDKLLEIIPRANFEVSAFETNPSALIRACNGMRKHVIELFSH